MLADIEIKELIQSGKIGIHPYREKSLRAGNYEVCLGYNLLIPKENQIVDIKKDSGSDILYDEIKLDDNGYIIGPHSFILAQTFEALSFANNIGAFIDGKSTLARLGISIHQSATALLPGQDKHIVTLEIFNAGPFQIRIYPKMPIGKIIFFQSEKDNEMPYKKYGKYANQLKTTQARIIAD